MNQHLLQLNQTFSRQGCSSFACLNRVIFAASILFLCCTTIVCAQVPSTAWDKTFGGSRNDNASVVIQTSDGGYLIGGSSYSDMSGDKSSDQRGGINMPGAPQRNDYWIVKISSTGSKEWDKAYGGSDLDELSAIIQTQDGGYLLGGTSNSNAGFDKSEASRGEFDYWIIKTDGFGNKQWDKTIGGGGIDRLASIIETPEGNFLLAGESSSNIGQDRTDANRGPYNVDYGGYLFDYWLVKVSSTGFKLWDKAYGGTLEDRLSSMIATTDGGYLLAGFSSSGSTGDKTEPNKGISDTGDYWIVKINNAGSKQWDKSFGGNFGEMLYSVIQTQDNGYLLGGDSGSDVSGDKSAPNKGNSDYWIVKTDSTGSKLWDQTLGGEDRDILRSLVQTPDGGFVLGGYSRSGISGDKSEANIGLPVYHDFWVIKTDGTGSKLWDKTYGGEWDEILSSMIKTGSEGLLLAGYSNSDISGDKTEASRGENDFWLLKLGSDSIPLLPATRVNFQSQWPKPPQGWIKDYGMPFGEKTVADSVLTYGWKRRDNGEAIDLSLVGSFSGNPGNGRHRLSPSDILLATLMHMQGNDVKNFRGTPVESYWEMAVPNGDYLVTVSAGDGSVYTFTDPESHSINVEGTAAITNFIPQGQQGSMTRFHQASVRVTVTDGYLTINADGGTNTKINYAIIQPLAIPAPEVVAKQPVFTAKPVVKKSMKVYPNPFQDKVSINISGQHGNTIVTVMDALGTIYYQTVSQFQTEEITVDLAKVKLKTGVYMIKLQCEDGTSKLIRVIKK